MLKTIKPNGPPLTTLRTKFCTKFFSLIIWLTLLFFKMKKKGADNQEIAKLSYITLIANKLLCCLHPYIRNRFQLSLHESIFLCITKHIKFVPEIHHRIENFQDLITSLNTPSIVFSTHTGFAFATRCISSIKPNIAVIANIGSSKGLKNTFKVSGVDNRINIIPNDKYCLARAKEQLNANATIICSVDFKADHGGTYNLMSPSLFKLANALNVPVYFHKDEILNNGQIKVSFKKANESASSVQLVDDFIAYINHSRTNEKKFTVAKYR